MNSKGLRRRAVVSVASLEEASRRPDVCENSTCFPFPFPLSSSPSSTKSPSAGSIGICSGYVFGLGSELLGASSPANTPGGVMGLRGSSGETERVWASRSPEGVLGACGFEFEIMEGLRVCGLGGEMGGEEERVERRGAIASV